MPNLLGSVGLKGLRVISRIVGAAIKEEVFAYLGYADDVSLLEQMAEMLLLLLEVMSRKAFCLEVSWDKTKIQITINGPAGQALSTTADCMQEVVVTFTCLSSLTVPSGSSEQENKTLICCCKLLHDFAG